MTPTASVDSSIREMRLVDEIRNGRYSVEFVFDDGTCRKTFLSFSAFDVFVRLCVSLGEPNGVLLAPEGEKAAAHVLIHRLRHQLSGAGLDSYSLIPFLHSGRYVLAVSHGTVAKRGTLFSEAAKNLSPEVRQLAAE